MRKLGTLKWAARLPALLPVLLIAACQSGGNLPEPSLTVNVPAELVAGEVSHQRAALEARVEVALQTSILAELMTVASQDSISPLREAFLSSRHRLTVAFELLPAEPGVVEAIATATQLEDLALAPQGVFA